MWCPNISPSSKNSLFLTIFFFFKSIQKLKTVIFELYTVDSSVLLIFITWLEGIDLDVRYLLWLMCNLYKHTLKKKKA